MADFLHTMVRITDPERSRRFYEALGFRFERDMDIVRNGELEATNYFFGIGGQDAVLELTYNHDGRTYELGTGYGHIALAVDDMTATLAELAEQGIEPEREPYRIREGGSLIAFVRDKRAAFADAVRLPLGLDSLLRELGERRGHIVDRERDVAVAGAELVRAAVVVVRQLEHGVLSADPEEVVRRLELAVPDDVHV